MEAAVSVHLICFCQPTKMRWPTPIIVPVNKYLLLLSDPRTDSIDVCMIRVPLFALPHIILVELCPESCWECNSQRQIQAVSWGCKYINGRFWNWIWSTYNVCPCDSCSCSHFRNHLMRFMMLWVSRWLKPGTSMHWMMTAKPRLRRQSSLWTAWLLMKWVREPVCGHSAPFWREQPFRGNRMLIWTLWLSRVKRTAKRRSKTNVKEMRKKQWKKRMQIHCKSWAWSRICCNEIRKNSYLFPGTLVWPVPVSASPCLVSGLWTDVWYHLSPLLAIGIVNSDQFNLCLFTRSWVSRESV